MALQLWSVHWATEWLAIFSRSTVSLGGYQPATQRHILGAILDFPYIQDTCDCCGIVLCDTA